MGSYAQRRHQTSCISAWIKFALFGVVISVLFHGALCDVEPTESQCRTYIEKALKEHHLDTDERVLEDAAAAESQNEEEENYPTDEIQDSIESSETKDDENDDEDEADTKTESDDSDDTDNDGSVDDAKTEENEDEEAKTDNQDDEEEENDEKENDDLEPQEGEGGNQDAEGDQSKEEDGEEEEETKDIKESAGDDNDDDTDNQDVISDEPIEIEVHEIELDEDEDGQDEEAEGQDEGETETQIKETEDDNDDDQKADADEENEEKDETVPDEADEEDKEKEQETTDNEDIADDDEEDKESTDNVDTEDKKESDDLEENEEEDKETEQDEEKDSEVEEKEDEEEKKDDDEADTVSEDEDEVKEEDIVKRDVRDLGSDAAKSEAEEEEQQQQQKEDSTEEKGEEAPEEELIKEVIIPDNLRPRTHISKILKLEDSNTETTMEKTIDTTLKTLKGLYDNAIKPLEMLYKYRDLSNRHFGDPEIFSKPLILFMGPWSGGKSSTINYLLDNEFSHTSLRTGAEPSPAYFNILMYGEEEEILDGTQLAADWTFSGLQKFGQGLLDRLRGIKLPNKLLEKVNIVEIPGILEIRKQVQRLFPFNDACQWFIDRADIIFLVYDPSKLDVGPETEAILDQLKGREYQTRIILNKADQVKPEELMRVQGTLIWNISPLMSSSEPPIMYSTSLWSLPYETGAPIRLLQAQERAFLRDLREAIDKRVENKIASARRFAVRVRNHAKMVDCYLTTYYNHKTIFGNRKKVSDDIIEFPQKYHIYEGLSTLTNISRYDLPDPDVYRDFFKINPLYEFKKLSETCTYFRGCPINKLDVAIAYDLPELVGKYKKAVEASKEGLQKENT